MSDSTSLLEEIRSFLGSLKSELPDLFATIQPPYPVRTRRLANSSEDKREEARAVLTERTEHWSSRIGVAYNQIRIKDQSSLWGSCSVNRNLNFNWRLVMAPAEVMDYVVIHELCHLIEMNHSKRFWDHVAAWCPDYKNHRRWLRVESRRLRN